MLISTKKHSKEVREKYLKDKYQSNLIRYEQLSALTFIYAYKNEAILKTKINGKEKRDPVFYIFKINENSEEDIISEGYKLLNEFKKKYTNSNEGYLPPKNDTIKKRDATNFYLIRNIKINDDYLKINNRILYSKNFNTVKVNMEKYMLDEFQINYDYFLSKLKNLISNKIKSTNDTFIQFNYAEIKSFFSSLYLTSETFNDIKERKLIEKLKQNEIKQIEKQKQKLDEMKNFIIKESNKNKMEIENNNDNGIIKNNNFNNNNDEDDVLLIDIDKDDIIPSNNNNNKLLIRLNVNKLKTKTNKNLLRSTETSRNLLRSTESNRNILQTNKFLLDALKDFK